MNFFRVRSFNGEAVLRTIILLAFVYYVHLLIRSEEIYLLVNPKMIPYIQVGIEFMLLMAALGLKDIFKIPRRKPRLSTYALFIVPLVIGFTFSPITMGAYSLQGRSALLGEGMSGSLHQESLQQQEFSESYSEGYSEGDVDNCQEREHYGKYGYNGGQEYYGEDDSCNYYGDQEDNEGYESYEGYEEHNYYDDSVYGGHEDREDMLEDGRLLLDDYNFYHWLLEIYTKLEEYKGYEIEAKGFVLREEDLKDNEVILARYVMVCCVADMQLLGIIVQEEESLERFNQDDWIRVKGVLEKGEFREEQLPVVNLEEIEVEERPFLEYIFPY